MDSSREYYNRIYLHNLNISSHPKYFKQRYSPFHALNQRSILLETEGNNKILKLYSSVYILQLHCMSNDGRDHFLPRVGGWQRNEVIFWGCQYSVVYGSKVMWGVGREWWEAACKDKERRVEWVSCHNIPRTRPQQSSVLHHKHCNTLAMMIIQDCFLILTWRTMFNYHNSDQ